MGSSERNSTAGGQGQWCTVLETKVSGALSLFLYRITPVTLPHIQPVQLNADPTNPTIGQNLTVVGFNDTAQDGDLLMEATVQVADPNVCDSMATDEGDLIVKRRTQFCTDTPLMGPCNGAWLVGIPLLCRSPPLATPGIWTQTLPHFRFIFFSLSGMYSILVLLD